MKRTEAPQARPVLSQSLASHIQGPLYAYEGGQGSNNRVQVSPSATPTSYPVGKGFTFSPVFSPNSPLLRLNIPISIPLNTTRAPAAGDVNPPLITTSTPGVWRVTKNDLMSSILTCCWLTPSLMKTILFPATLVG